MDAPTEIWIDTVSGDDGFWRVAGADIPRNEEMRSVGHYIRADIANAERDAALALGVGISANIAEQFWTTHGGTREELRSDANYRIRDAIRATATMTPLQAALALPEVREFVEALRRISVLDQAMIWGEDTEIRKAFDDAQKIAIATLAKLEAKG